MLRNKGLVLLSSFGRSRQGSNPRLLDQIRRLNCSCIRRFNCDIYESIANIIAMCKHMNFNLGAFSLTRPGLGGRLQSTLTKFLVIFSHLPTDQGILLLLKVKICIPGNDISSTTYLPRFVNVICERP